MNPFLEVAIEVAQEAGSILRSEFEEPAKISYKGEADLVTQADRRSEQAIVGRLRKLFPDHSIEAEEGSGIEASSGFRWFIDPLDGTTNFAHGYPCFAVSMGLAQAGELLAGVIYQPISQELFTAARGEGAFLNGKPIRVSPIEQLATSLVATGFPGGKRANNRNIHYYRDFTVRSHGVRRDGSAALDLASVACGRFEGFWEFGLHSWDTGAGVLLVREAGGRATRFSGEPYRPGDPEILATNGAIHEEMRQLALAIGEKAAAHRIFRNRANSVRARALPFRNESGVRLIDAP